MAALKRHCVLPLLSLLVLSIDPTAAEVVELMSDCAEFLLNETPPQVPGILEGGRILNPERYKPICQTLNNTRHFVTLYDTENKIPVFSAYKYTGDDGGRRPGRPRWKIEPQLENYDKNMKVPGRSQTYDHQAAIYDYNNKDGFDRGHLFPSSYGYNQDDKNSTFTLTNIVPQEAKFNQGRWNNMEKCIKCVLDQYCSDMNNNIEGFLVTGAKPGNNSLNNKINIPSMLWSAFCCYSHLEMNWLASAHWGENVQDNSTHLQTKTLAELHSELGIEVFPGSQCPDNTTVTELYPQVNSVDITCKCPPTISTTSAPSTATFTPSVLTSAPLETTTAPPTTTSGLSTATSSPLTDTSAPFSSTAGQPSSTSASSSSTAGQPPSRENRSTLAGLGNVFNELLGEIADLVRAIWGILGSGEKNSYKSSPINPTPIATLPKTSDTTSIPATTVSVAAITSTGPPDNTPAVPTNPKATASEQPTTRHPATDTPLTTATAPKTTSVNANSDVTTALTQTASVSEEGTSTN